MHLEPDTLGAKERRLALEIGLPEVLLKLTYTIARVGEVLAGSWGGRKVVNEAAYRAHLASQPNAPEPPPPGTEAYGLIDFLEPGLQTYLQNQTRRAVLEQVRFKADKEHLHDIVLALRLGALNPEAENYIQAYMPDIEALLKVL